MALVPCTFSGHDAVTKGIMVREARVHAEFSLHVSLNQALAGLMYRRVGGFTTFLELNMSFSSCIWCLLLKEIG